MEVEFLDDYVATRDANAVTIHIQVVWVGKPGRLTFTVSCQRDRLLHRARLRDMDRPVELRSTLEHDDVAGLEFRLLYHGMRFPRLGLRTSFIPIITVLGIHVVSRRNDSSQE